MVRMSVVHAALIEGKYGNEAVNNDPQSPRHRGLQSALLLLLILIGADALAYLHIFKRAERPEVVCQVVARDVIVRHREITLHAPVRAPRVADKHTLV